MGWEDADAGQILSKLGGRLQHLAWLDIPVTRLYVQYHQQQSAAAMLPLRQWVLGIRA